MQHRWLLFTVILSVLFVYTAFKVKALIPGEKVIPWGIAVGFFLLVVAWQFIYRSDPTLLNSFWFQVLCWGGSLGMGLWATFMIFSFPVDFVSSLFFKWKEVNSLTALDPERRSLLSQSLSLGVLGLSGGIAGLGWAEVSSGPRVQEVEVTIEQLPQGLSGLKIAQISDLHVGPTIHRSYVEKTVQAVVALKPDLIVVTGDLADGTPEVLENHLKPLADLKAPLGTYYVTGNHEYYWGVEKWIQKVTQLGFIPLLNENKVVDYHGNKILVAGVTDSGAHQFMEEHRSDPKKAALSSEQCDFKLLLAHRPDSCFEAEPQGFHLQLSGHTHAGQFFPWNLFVRMAHKYYRGLNRHGKMWVYVNAGTGYWGPIHRFAVPAEITLVRLKA